MYRAADATVTGSGSSLVDGELHQAHAHKWKFVGAAGQGDVSGSGRDGEWFWFFSRGWSLAYLSPSKSLATITRNSPASSEALCSFS